MGGMGNQIFQYATALALSMRLGTDMRMDISRFDNPNEFRLYSLGLFAGVIEQCVHGMSGMVIREQGMPYNEHLFANVPDDVSIYGYFQTEKYFSWIRNKLLSRLVPSKPLTTEALDILNVIENEGDKSVFLTVRRTDYVNSTFHGLMPMSYYEKAADIIASKV